MLQSRFSPKAIGAVMPDVTVTYRNVTIAAKKEPFQFIEFLFRKGAHLLVYGILAALAYSAVAGTGKETAVKVVGILLLTGCIAALDEWNQRMSAARTGAIQDVWIDMAGACGGLLVCLLRFAGKRPAGQ